MLFNYHYIFWLSHKLSVGCLRHLNRDSTISYMYSITNTQRSTKAL